VVDVEEAAVEVGVDKGVDILRGGVECKWLLEDVT